MTRKRLTEIFPWLLPIRQKQRKVFYYLGMHFDGNRYAKKQTKGRLAHEIYRLETLMVNPDSGYDIQYQYNKVHNLKLAAAGLDGLLIQPGETFSICLAMKNADRDEPYKDGLSLVDGKIRGEYGGGLCQMSNTLYQLFLHSPLAIMERHGHENEAIPPADDGYVAGLDATIAEGWLDLKVKNETAHKYQIAVGFDDKNMTAALLSDSPKVYDYEIYNSALQYVKRGEKIFEESTVARRCRSVMTGECSEEELYDNSCEITYPIEKVVQGA